MSTTAYIYPTGTPAPEWTPSAVGDDHHLLLDEVYPPGNTADYIQAGGTAAGTEKLSYESGPVDIERITAFKFAPLHFSGEEIALPPGIKFELVVNGAVVGSRSVSVSTGGVVTATNGITFGGLNIPGYTWYNSTREVWITPLDLTGNPLVPMEDG